MLSITMGQITHSGSIWIDFNQDSIFSPGEWFDLGRRITPGTTVNVPIFVPTSVLSGRTKARIRFRIGSSPNGADNACLSFGTGYTFEINVNIDLAIGCTAAPNTPVIDQTAIALCPNDSTLLSYTNASNLNGTSLLWQKSIDNGLTWLPAPGRNTFASYYANSNLLGTRPALLRLKAACTNLGNDAYSQATTYRQKLRRECYCKPNPVGNCSTDSQLKSISASSFNPALPSLCLGNSYFVGLQKDTLQVVLGSINTLTIKTGASILTGSLFIDYDTNGVFNNYEWVDLGRNLPAYNTNTISYFASSGIGSYVTTARFRIIATGANNSASACATYTRGQVLDFVCKLIQPTACTGLPIVPNISVSASKICIKDLIFATFNNLPLTNGNDYNWELSIDNGNTWSNAAGGNNIPIYIVDSLSFNNATGLQIRVKITCTASGLYNHSNVVSLGVSNSLICFTCKPKYFSCDPTALVTRFYSTAQGFDLNLPTDCASGNMGFFTLLGSSYKDTLNLATGIPVTIGIQTANFSPYTGALWVDYDNNGVFDPAEYTKVGDSLSSSKPGTFDVTAPPNAFLGVVVGHLRTRSAGNPNGPTNACTPFYFGTSYDFPVRVGTTVGLNQKLGSISIGVYPNPASGSVTVELPSAEAAQFTLTDMSGKVVSDMTPSAVNGNRYTLPLNVATGTYSLTVLTNSGIAHKKLVVK
jgi:hypothetical protein